MMNQKRSFFQRFKKTIIAGVIFLLLMLAFANWLGFRHVPEHVRELYSMITSLFNRHDRTENLSEAQKAALNTADTVITDVALPAPMEPVDTVFLAAQIKQGGYVPPSYKEDLERIRKTDFSKLQKATDKPTDQEVEQALVRRYGEELINLIRPRQAHIRAGQCYNAPLQQTPNHHQEIARVTCMVSAFNNKNENIGNIQQPLGIVYDFVKLESDPNTWYVTDYSQTIPFDYKLNKR
ncbi:hypothetical protein [Mucilaginibacter paludis]|uniref:Uncharacterized protein n=1 Tax=Mucilaginibacter paludis DSM 18603 TaxID=714943 RepID=H1YA81_9SPHI|nr:hypothetical protein [Mucilaginibacter paludis]EHQ25962.1 hypothetical protein Mucpa_1808 [Mucilaginibacter paludis DSM 18603]